MGIKTLDQIIDGPFYRLTPSSENNGRSKTIYIVSGYMRTGTSMMMAALEAGGLCAAFDPNREELNERFGDEHYKPNPGGFYELDRKEYQHPDFPLMYTGKLVKCLFGGLQHFPVNNAGYKVVFMIRDPEEIRQSYEAFFDVSGKAREKMYKFLTDRYYQVMNDAVIRLRNRKDTSVNVYKYRDVLEQPVEIFTGLVASGWPIDISSAASVIDPKQCRFKVEELTVGL